MLTVKEALQEAVKDHNQWADKPHINAPYYGMAELRGIFFNKLITRMKEVSTFGQFHDLAVRCIDVCDLVAEFKDKHIIGLGVVIPQYGPTAKKEWLSQIHEAIKETVFDTLPDESYYGLEKIIKQLKAYK